MKELNSLVIIIGILVAGGAIFFGAQYFADRYLSPDIKSSIVECSGQHANHDVTIKNDKLSATHVNASLCDTLTITNQDNEMRLIAFGEHEHHTPYDGVTEEALKQGQSLSVTLNQLGNFKFHDHIHDEVQGTFTVAK